MFFNKNQLPPELQNLSPEQMTEYVAAANKASADLAAEKTARAAAEAAAASNNTQATAGRDAVERLKKLREAGLVDEKGDPIQRTAAANNSNNNDTNNNSADDLTDILTDPGKVIDSHTKPTQVLAMIAAMNTARLMAENQVSNLPGRDGQIARKVWRKYASEIQALVDKEPMLRRCDPGVWMMALTHIQGTRFGDILKDIQTEGDGFFVEGVVQTGSGGLQTTPDKGDTLTPEEEKVIKKYGITKERYLKQRKSMDFGPAPA